MHVLCSCTTPVYSCVQCLFSTMPIEGLTIPPIVMLYCFRTKANKKLYNGVNFPLSVYSAILLHSLRPTVRKGKNCSVVSFSLTSRCIEGFSRKPRDLSKSHNSQSYKKYCY